MIYEYKVGKMATHLYGPEDEHRPQTKFDKDFIEDLCAFMNHEAKEGWEYVIHQGTFILLRRLTTSPEQYDKLIDILKGQKLLHSTQSSSICSEMHIFPNINDEPWPGYDRV